MLASEQRNSILHSVVLPHLQDLFKASDRLSLVALAWLYKGRRVIFDCWIIRTWTNPPPQTLSATLDILVSPLLHEGCLWTNRTTILSNWCVELLLNLHCQLMFLIVSMHLQSYVSQSEGVTDLMEENYILFLIWVIRWVRPFCQLIASNQSAFS